MLVPRGGRVHRLDEHFVATWSRVICAPAQDLLGERNPRPPYLRSASRGSEVASLREQ
jgi:hypothetical protein